MRKLSEGDIINLIKILSKYFNVDPPKIVFNVDYEFKILDYYALYDTESCTIYIDENYLNDFNKLLHILAHEYVHHLQNKEITCRCKFNGLRYQLYEEHANYLGESICKAILNLINKLQIQYIHDHQPSNPS